MTPDDDPPPDANPLIYTEVERASMPKTYDAGDPAQVRKLQTDTELRTRLVRDFYQSVFSTDIGRLAMWDILQSLHTFETKFNFAAGVAHEAATFFDAGKQAGGWDLYLSWLKFDHDGVTLMLEENHSDLRSIDGTVKPRKRRARKSSPSAI